jgi:tRNA(Ile)-lysidine synthase TilS/MesJ
MTWWKLHQDDVVETAIINLLRGTGRKGLTALGSRPGIVRPLLSISKTDILRHAKQHQLEWHEDATNIDTKYLRNYVRYEILPKFSDEQKQQFLGIIESQKNVNDQLDNLLQLNTKQLNRNWFVGLPHEVAREVMASWLRSQGLREFDKPTIERAVVGVKTARSGKKIAIKKDEYIEVGKEYLALRYLER